MFKNLDAEQARSGKTNQAMADLIGISRVSYESKKRTGKFTVKEIATLCKFFETTFEYLFATDKKSA